MSRKSVEERWAENRSALLVAIPATLGDLDETTNVKKLESVREYTRELLKSLNDPRLKSGSPVIASQSEDIMMLANTLLNKVERRIDQLKDSGKKKPWYKRYLGG